MFRVIEWGLIIPTPHRISCWTQVIVHLIDGTYELFRHFYGLRRFNKGVDRPYGAVVGVLQTVLQMIEAGNTYLGVATDYVIESFRNRLWAGDKTGAGIEPDGYPGKQIRFASPSHLRSIRVHRCPGGIGK